MSVIVLVLKIIGILLLILLGILLAALLAVLFVPVRYRIFGQVEDDSEVHMCASWLFHLISFSLEYRDGENRMGVKLLVFPSGESREGRARRMPESGRMSQRMRKRRRHRRMGKLPHRRMRRRTHKPPMQDPEKTSRRMCREVQNQTADQSF